ncbi:MAG: hypothetical protein NUV97_02005 [archaeon]|nr:hypothetical protein [archaeon]MCR4323725.1 hypothetical protein [Nanoarchaeota archaeon]
MNKGLLSFSILFLLVFSVSFVFAADLISCRDDCKINYQTEVERSECIRECESIGGIEDIDYSNVEDISGGIGPDSPFYFVDKFLDDVFGDPKKVREERAAEAKDALEKGDTESVEAALKSYDEIAVELEKEVNPEEVEEVKEGSLRIQKALLDVEEESFDVVRERERELVTAGEIAGKIKELCQQLAELDPLEYDKMCRTDDDSPKWQKELDKDLSAEQKEIAKKFVDTMKQCFKTSGKDCACEEIPFQDFSIACSKASEAAYNCDIGGDKEACDDLESLDMPRLPDWLEPIWQELEDGMMESKYDMHMPKECDGLGPNECRKVMIEKNSPIECRAALLEADVQSESEGRKICDEIMKKKYGPKDCEGLSPEECADKMGGDFESPIGGRGFGGDCSGIEDKMERLNCYDNMDKGMENNYGPKNGGGEITWQCKENRIHWGPDCEKFMKEEWPEQEKMKRENRKEQEGDWRAKQDECVNKCESQGRPWDYSGGECVCGEPGQYYNKEKGFYDESECKDGCNDECPGASRTNCINDKCECYYENDEPQYDEGEGPSGEIISSQPDTTPEPQQSPEEPEEREEESLELESNSGDSGREDSGGDEGGSMITGNVFLDYYWD